MKQVAHAPEADLNEAAGTADASRICVPAVWPAPVNNRNGKWVFPRASPTTSPSASYSL